MLIARDPVVILRAVDYLREYDIASRHSQHDAAYADRIINLFDGEVVDNTVL